MSAAGTADDPRSTGRRLPAGHPAGRRTPVFTAGSVPPALLTAHRTTVWAELVVVAGSVEFREDEPELRVIVSSGQSMVIVPGRDHRIEPSADARFHIQFYDDPATGGERA